MVNWSEHDILTVLAASAETLTVVRHTKMLGKAAQYEVELTLRNGQQFLVTAVEKGKKC